MSAISHIREGHATGGGVLIVPVDADAVQVPTSHAHAVMSQEIVVSSVEMRIRNGGHGFDPRQSAASGNYGQGMMRERAEAVGADLTVASRPGHGTEVTLHWPETSKQEA